MHYKSVLFSFFSSLRCLRVHRQKCNVLFSSLTKKDSPASKLKSSHSLNQGGSCETNKQMSVLRFDHLFKMATDPFTVVTRRKAIFNESLESCAIICTLAGIICLFAYLHKSSIPNIIEKDRFHSYRSNL